MENTTPKTWLQNRAQRNATKGVHTLITAESSGLGRTHVLRAVVRGLTAAFHGVVILPLFGVKTKAQVANQLHFSLFDRRCAISETAGQYAGMGGRDRLLDVTNALQALPKVRFVCVVDDIDELEPGAVEALQAIELPNVTFIVSSTAGKLRERTRAFLSALRPAVLEVRPLPDRAISELLDNLLAAKGVADDAKWKDARRKLIKIAAGNPGALAKLVDSLCKEDNEKAFTERVDELALQTHRVINYQRHALLICIAGFAVSLSIHATTSSVYRLLASVFIGSIALAAYRLLLNDARNDNAAREV